MHGTDRNPPTAIPNFRSRYLHLSNVMDTKDISGNDLNNPYTEPEAPRMGRRRPHVPSSKPTMSKNNQTNQADNQPVPLFTSGDLMSVYCWRPDQSISASRPVKRPLSPTPDSVNNVFAILFHSRGKYRFSGVFAPPSQSSAESGSSSSHRIYPESCGPRVILACPRQCIPDSPGRLPAVPRHDGRAPYPPNRAWTLSFRRSAPK